MMTVMMMRALPGRYLGSEQSREIDLGDHLAAMLSIAMSITVLWFHLSMANITMCHAINHTTLEVTQTVPYFCREWTGNLTINQSIINQMNYYQMI